MAENNNGRRTNLQLLDAKRDELATGLVTYKQFLDVIPPNKQEQFKKNFLELATQDYLLSIVETKEIIRFAANVTKTGLDIAPSSKEVYIIPFDTKVNGQKIMLPQAIIPLNGMQQLAYAKGFFLELDAVWKFDDNNSEAASKLSRLQQSQLRTADSKWVEQHFIGFDVTLKDLKKELPTQTVFVDLNYVQEATKTIKDERWKLQTWRHKAVRRAYGDFMIPRERKIEAFEEIENLNDSVLIEADVVSGILLTSNIEAAITQMGLSLAKQNGTAIITGQTFGKDKLIKDLGFVFSNNKWSMEYKEADKKVSLQTPKPKQSTAATPVKELMSYLKDNGLTKDEIGDFVKNTLKLSSEDTVGIQAVLDNRSSLDENLQKFIDSMTEAKEVF
ncbi:hypothetical protein SAMN06313486_10146 [Epsilonproteobacteria bacterium SCGC AD-308-P11]|nr:hypothetical protein SAMN06313486_10146 [Epsilonproteobacteria bacterium SCGC AD-308-P11]